MSEPDWLADIAPGAEDTAARMDTSDDEAALDWLAADDEAEAVEAEISDEPVMAMDEADEAALAAADAPPPAENAPDWLNAMVPGLDLDYEATEEDEPVESAYVESAPSSMRAETPSEPKEAERNIDWLVEIVDEETTEFKPIKDEAPPKRRRFSFSRQPAWLRVPTEKDDEDEPDNDFELPDWLQ